MAGFEFMYKWVENWRDVKRVSLSYELIPEKYFARTLVMRESRSSHVEPRENKQLAEMEKSFKKIFDFFGGKQS